MRFFYRWLLRRTVHHFVPQRDTKMVWQFSFFFVVSLIKWDWKKICWVLILVSGKVQVSLVWNSRNEKSHNADKLQALSSVSFSWFLSLVPLNCSAGFSLISFLICSSCGERVDPIASFTWSILSGLTFRRQPTMWVREQYFLMLGPKIQKKFSVSFCSGIMLWTGRFSA